LDSSGEHGFQQRIENCYYQGTVAGDSSSFVALSSCNGLRGIIAFSNGSTYGVWPLDVGDRGRRHPHILYKTHWTQEAKCGTSMAPIEHTIRRRVSGMFPKAICSFVKIICRKPFVALPTLKDGRGTV
ncbi:reprolysin family propeptide, partial [Cooperia oncophora]